MAKVIVWHNPGCGSSKNAVEYLQEKNIEPEIYLYLKQKPGKKELQALLKQMKAKPSGLLRPKEKDAEALGLYSGASEDAILDAMAANSKLIQRPVVITEKGALIARPKSRIDEIL